LWTIEKRCLKDIILTLRDRRPPSLSHGLSSHIKSSTFVELIDDFEEKKDEKRINENCIQLSLTELLKKLVTDVMPPTDNGNFYMVSQAEMEIIYKIIFE
jgi:hypothetical protein